MRTDVFYNGESVGVLCWTPDKTGVQVELDCAVCGDGAILRCWGICGGRTLRIGLPAPEHGRLRLHRHLSRETLREVGCENVPERFYLAAAPERSSEGSSARLCTGDTVLDALLECGEVEIRQMENGVRLRCPLDPKKPFALAPAFVLCRAEGDHAVLDWLEKKDAASKPRPSSGT